MVISKVTEDNYPILTAWWAFHKWGAVPLDHLPEIGLLVSENGLNLCAGFLYETNSKFALLEFIISNPLCDKLLRDRALDILIDSLIQKAKEKGFKTVFSSIQSTALIKRYEKHGAIKTDTNMTNFVWSL